MAIGDTVQAGLMRTDSSAIERAGQANASANKSFGVALGQVAKGYFVGQEKKARANEIKEELMRQGVPEDAAGNISKNPFLQKEHARKEEAKDRLKLAKMASKNASDSLAQKADFQTESNRRFEIGQDDKEALQEKTEEAEANQMEVAEALLAETTDPAVVEDFNQAQPGLFALGGDQGARNRFLEFQKDEAPKVLGGELGSSDFGRFAKEQNLDPVLASSRFMNLQKAEQAVAKENTGKLGDQFSSRVGALQPYYFSESDATNAVSNEATKLGINLNKDQLAQAVSKQKIIPTKDLRSAADTRFSKLNLDEPRTVLEAADDLEAFLTEGNPLSSSVAKEKLARMVQPQGILTEDDLKRMGGSQAFMDRFQSFIEQQKTGTLDAKLKEYLQETTAVFRKRAQEVLMEKTDFTVNSLANNFEITPEEVRKYTQFGGLMYGFDQPSNQGPQQGQPPQNPSGPQPITLPNSKATFTPIAQ
tara:strand:+ start:538 stop:1968 length:1431 start_codon:yes stop_codon:yes gene_type:complete